MAGRTSARSAPPWSSAEHPRDGGEDVYVDALVDYGDGTPPRWRGGRRAGGVRRQAHRNTPAMAGRTGDARCAPRFMAEHPRDGGEDGRREMRATVHGGTPPRWRGGPVLLFNDRDVQRNTPAMAGRTDRLTPQAAAASEHPRDGGEDHRERDQVQAVVGTPPRWRGGPVPDRYGGVAVRNTPAMAGRTGSRGRTIRRTAEHPRDGGEDSLKGLGGGFKGGTPPRWRGGRQGRDLGDGPRRNTPAMAGRTTAGRAARCRGSEHPRDGGEDGCGPGSCRYASGTPPRWRGGQAALFGEPLHLRNTPAMAGRTRAAGEGPHRLEEHPRDGGEDIHAGRGDVEIAGTPPRWRGGRLPGLRVGEERRNTPAMAGRTLAAETTHSPQQEHPRDGGEDCTWSKPSFTSCGTPPRWRGGRSRCGLFTPGCRNTPAMAGRTTTPCIGWPSRSEHPRDGGEDRGHWVSTCGADGTPPRWRGGPHASPSLNSLLRNTPAMAGRTHCSSSSPHVRSEHPRDGGEDTTLTKLGRKHGGTPPRWRGGRRGRLLDLRAQRNTPAMAGRTVGGLAIVIRSPEHPRDGGEDSKWALAWWSAHGTPPRWRGGPTSSVQREQEFRNTPAMAGRTLPDLHLKRGFAFP